MTKAKKEIKEIVEVDCIISTTKEGNGLLVSWENDMYITNVDFVNQLLDGKLMKKDKTVAKGVKLGLLTKDGIDATELYLNVKGKSFYFAPSEDRLFIAPVSVVKDIIAGKVIKTHMGELPKQE